MAIHRSEPQEAERLLRLAAVEASRFSPCDPRISKTQEELGDALLAQKKYSECEQVLKQGLAERIKCLGPDNVLVAVALQRLGDACLWLQDRQRAAECYRREIAILEKLRDADDLVLARPLLRLASVMEMTGDLESAARLTSRAISIRERAIGANSPSLSDDLLSLSRYRLRQGKYMEAAESAERAVKLTQQSFGANSLRSLDLLLALSNAYINAKKFDLADKSAHGAFAIAEAKLAPDDARTIQAAQLLAAVLDVEGKQEQIERLERKILAYADKHSELDSNMAWYLGRRAQQLQMRKQYASAIAFYKKALPRLPANEILTRIYWVRMLGECQFENKQLDDAVGSIKLRLSLISSVNARQGLEAGRALYWLGRTYVLQGKQADAVMCFQESCSILSRFPDRQLETEALKAHAELLRKIGDGQKLKAVEARLKQVL